MKKTQAFLASKLNEQFLINYTRYHKRVKKVCFTSLVSSGIGLKGGPKSCAFEAIPAAMIVSRKWFMGRRRYQAFTRHCSRTNIEPTTRQTPKRLTTTTDQRNMNVAQSSAEITRILLLSILQRATGGPRGPMATSFWNNKKKCVFYKRIIKVGVSCS